MEYNIGLFFRLYFEVTSRIFSDEDFGRLLSSNPEYAAALQDTEQFMNVLPGMFVDACKLTCMSAQDESVDEETSP